MNVQCLKHEGSNLLYIIQRENEVEFICDQCLSNLIDKNELVDFNRIINIKKAHQYPEYLFSKITNSQKLQEFFKELIQYDEQNLDQQLMEIEQYIKQIQNQLTVMQQELYVYKKKYIELRLQIRENLEEIIKFDQFKQYIANQNQLEKTINTQDIRENEKNVYIYFQNSIKNKLLSVNNQVFTILEYKNKYMKEPKIDYPELKKLDKLYQQLNGMHNSFNNIINPQFPGTIQNTQLITREFQAKLIDTIVKKSKKQIYKIELIHQQSQCNLNVESFWNIVDGKDNLLMVFKSQSETIFGAYTPCQWVKSKIGQYVSDETLTSFIFSQTKNQIYPIKQESRAYAIYCYAQHGPVFGGTSLFSRSILSYFADKSDLLIHSDFQNGSSKLGITYEVQDYQTKSESETILFGQNSPKIKSILILINQFNFQTIVEYKSKQWYLDKIILIYYKWFNYYSILTKKGKE